MQVNEKSLIATLKDSFSNDYSVITELAQNARRAGADGVTFQVDNLQQCAKDDFAVFDLTVFDNGKGVEDMQSLLSVASSGWDSETIEEEEPFGMGFLIAIYSSDSVEVTSNGKQFSATREELLSLKEIEVKEVPVEERTRIKLHGVTLRDVNSFEDFCGLVSSKLSCFPIEVDMWLGDTGGEIEFVNRKYAVEFIDSKLSNYAKFKGDIGDVYIHKSARLSPYSNGVEIIAYQGLLVERMSYGIHPGNDYANVVVHLNSKAGTIRLPDRDSFVNNREVSTKVSTLINEAMVKFIYSKKDDFFFLNEIKHALKRFGCLHLLNDHNRLPGSVLSTFESFNCDAYDNTLHPDDTSWLYEYNYEILDREDMPQHIIIVDSETPHLFSLLDSEDANAFALAFALESLESFSYALVKSGSLDPDHWVYKDAIPFIDLLDTVKVSMQGGRKPSVAFPAGLFPESTFRLCNSFTVELSVAGKTFKCSFDDRYVLFDDEETGLCTAYTDKCNDIDAIVESSVFAIDEYTIDEGMEEVYREKFTEWLARERSYHDDLAFIALQLSKVDLSHLEGKKFQIVFQEGEAKVSKL